MRKRFITLCHKKRGEEGFTLLEVLIAIAIFAIGIMGVLKMQISAMQGTNSTRVYLDTANLAQDRLELIIAASIQSTALNAGNYNDPNPPAGYAISWTITDNGGATNNAKTITVVATHSSGNRSTLTMVKPDDGA
jgi:type IV pilus assembly protein PilV